MDKYEEPEDMFSTWCPKCEEFKDPKLFTGRGIYCSECLRPKPKDDRIRLRAKDVYEIFGQEEYYSLLKEQDGKCAICLTDKCSSGFRFSIDHNHVTGKIRGLLCRDCNQVLGKFKEDIDRFLRAAMYLNLHK